MRAKKWWGINKKMFGFTKKTPQNQDGNKNNSSNQNQAVAFDIDTAPIHTMQDDLKNLKNPSTPSNATITEEKPSSTIQPVLSQKQSNSPFLNLADKNPINGIIAAEEKKSATIDQAENISNKTKSAERTSAMPFMQNQKNPEKTSRIAVSNFKATPSIITDPAVSHNHWRVIFFSTLSLFVIVALGWIGFNYSLNGIPNPFKQNTLPITLQPVQTEPTTPVEEPATKPTLSYSEVNPNYLRLEDPSLDSGKIQTILKQYFDKISQEGYVAPVEFVVTDAQNKPIGFKAFSGLLGLKFSPALLALLGENFSLFIYNDIPAPRIGLTIDSKDDLNLAKVLPQEEKLLADEISPLLFTNDYNKTKPFETTDYSGAKIHYQNIISPDNLAVDYAIYKNKLILGTARSTMRTIIDRQNEIAAKGINNQTPPPLQEKPVTAPAN